MHVHQIKCSFLKLQKLILPSDTYSEVNSTSNNQFALISVDKTYKVLAKIQRCNEPSVSDSCFLDFSVIQPETPWLSFDFSRKDVCVSAITPKDIDLAQSVSITPNVEVTIVVNSAVTLQKLKKEATKLPILVRDLLKPFCFCKNSLIFLENVPKTVSLNLYCVVIENLKGKQNALYTVNDKTSVLIINVLSYSLLQQKHALLKNAVWDKLFLPLNNNPTRLQTVASRIQAVLKLARSYDTFPAALVCMKNLLLVGTNGCGKTSVVEATARHTGFIVLTVNCGNLSLLPIGSAKNKLDSVVADACIHAENGEPCVILLKDVDLLTVKRNDTVTRSSQTAVSALWQYLEVINVKPNIAVIGTSNSPENISGRLRRLGGFSEELEMPMLTAEDRESVVRIIAECFLVPCDKVVAKEVAKWTPGFVLGDLLAVVKESRVFLLNEQDLEPSSQVKCYRKAVSLTTATAIKGARGLVTSKKTFFSDIGGLEKVKKQLRTSIQWPLMEPEAFIRLGIPPTKGILLYGPPGCAKTMLVKALACECNTTFLAVSSADLYSPYVGESEKRLARLFTQARIAAPAIVFIDEIDALVGNKDGGRERGVQERILATLLVEMDGVGRRVITSNSLCKVAEGDPSQFTTTDSPSSITLDNSGIIVVGATNRPELIDEALKRPGRFDKLIHVPPPNASERLAILRTVTSGMKFDKSVNLESIAQRAEQFSGADLKSLCTESALHALTSRGMDVSCVTAGDFDSVLKSFRTSLSLEMIKSYDNAH